MQRCRAKVERGAWWHAAFAGHCLLLLLLALPTAVRAAPVEVPALMNLDLPAQNLAPALEAFSRATGMAVLVDRELTRGRRSIGVHGRYSAPQALGVLLTGTGLMARYARSDAFTLQVPEVSTPASTRGPKARGADQQQLRHGLAAGHRAQSVPFAADPPGQLSRPGSGVGQS